MICQSSSVLFLWERQQLNFFDFRRYTKVPILLLEEYQIEGANHTSFLHCLPRNETLSLTQIYCCFTVGKACIGLKRFVWKKSRGFKQVIRPAAVLKSMSFRGWWKYEIIPVAWHIFKFPIHVWIWSRSVHIKWAIKFPVVWIKWVFEILQNSLFR